MPASGTWLADTWSTGDRIGEVESLSVLPETAGRGWGLSSWSSSTCDCANRAPKDLILGALSGNADAIRLYERHGYQPTWLYLSRLDGRDRGRAGRPRLGDDIAPSGHPPSLNSTLTGA